MAEQEPERGPDRDPAPEMVPYRPDPGLPDTERPADFPEEVWPPPNPNLPEPRRPEWAQAPGPGVVDELRLVPPGAGPGR